MIPIPVPDEAAAGRPHCQRAHVGPPPGVPDELCGTPEMLIAPTSDLGFGQTFYVYYRPSPEELAQLAAGGFIEFAQIGAQVQPFSAGVWPPPPATTAGPPEAGGS